MADGKLILITGRTTKQGTGISAGKGLADYRETVTLVDLSPADMARFRLDEGDTVRLRTRYGEATARCRRQELPEGLAFMAFGPAAGRLVGSETHTSGMPDSKAFEVELERVPD